MDLFRYVVSRKPSPEVRKLLSPLILAIDLGRAPAEAIHSWRRSSQYKKAFLLDREAADKIVKDWEVRL